uniref:CSON012030 protein n=1 Tax=Culicoides sonorensis TaxID=179676 RepID=A0A336N1Z4_CULSO
MLKKFFVIVLIGSFLNQFSGSPVELIIDSDIDGSGSGDFLLEIAIPSHEGSGDFEGSGQSSVQNSNVFNDIQDQKEIDHDFSNKTVVVIEQAELNSNNTKNGTNGDENLMQSIEKNEEGTTLGPPPEVTSLNVLEQILHDIYYMHEEESTTINPLFTVTFSNALKAEAHSVTQPIHVFDVKYHKAPPEEQESPNKIFDVTYHHVTSKNEINTKNKPAPKAKSKKTKKRKNKKTTIDPFADQDPTTPIPEQEKIEVVNYKFNLSFNNDESETTIGPF